MYRYKGLDSLKKTQSIWNMLNFFRKEQKLAAFGNEIQGIVIKQGINNKTVTVRGWWRYWENKRKRVRHTANSYQVHDENNYCRVGDIVVIKQCGSMSNRKGYFVRNVVHQAARFELLESNNLDEIIHSNYYREGEDKQEEDERFQAMLERIKHIKNLGMFDIDKSVIVLGYFTGLAFFMPHLLELNTEDQTILNNSRISLCIATGIYFIMMIILSISYKSSKEPENRNNRHRGNQISDKPSKYD